MIRSMNHSSFPKVGDRPMDQEMRIARRRHEAGKLDRQGLEDKIDEITSVAVAQQSRAFVDIVTDGMIRWDGPLSHLGLSLGGTRAGRQRRWFDTNFYEPTVIVEGPLGRRPTALVHDYRVASDVAQRQPLKVVLPGPVTFARSADNRHYDSTEALAHAFAGILVDEVTALREAGADWLQVDEPLLCRHPEDAALVSETTGRLFDALGPNGKTVLSTYFGSLEPLGDGVASLPGTYLGLDVTDDDENLKVIERLPADRGVALGVLDARTTQLEDAADVAARLAPFREQLVTRDVLVGPNAGLELLPQDQAFDKLLHARYLVEQLGKEWTWA